MKNKRLIANIVEIVIGVVLTVCGAFGVVDSYWSGMGGALIAVGALSLVRSIRYHTDKEYQEKTDVENQDERNRFLSMKAWSWAGYLFVMTSAVASIVLKIVGQDTYSTVAGFAVCFIITLYWVSWLILRKKY